MAIQYSPSDSTAYNSLQSVAVIVYESGDEHISFTTSKIGSLVDVNQSRDPDGLRCFYYLVQVTNIIERDY